MWLPWEYGVVLAALFGSISWRANSDYRRIAAFANEAAVVAILYSLWQLAGKLSLMGIDDAIDRGARLWEFERAIGLPDELAWQNAMVPHSLTTQVANIYYAGAHVPAMGVFLVWLFLRHGDVYRGWRNTLAIITGVCLTIQLVPVAPPRLVSETGMIDTGLAYGQSVYGALGRGIAGQLQAMPSIHVAWAALIGWAVWVESPSRWRWVGPAHFTLTFLVVALTGNHYWLDGIVAMILLVPAWAAGVRLARFTARRWDRIAAGSTGEREPVLTRS